MIRILSQSTHGRLPANQIPLVEGIYSVKAKASVQNRWFVIYTDPQYEKRVSQALVARAVSHYLPRARRWKRQSRRAKHQREPKRHVTSPLLTRYVFAALPADELHFGRITDLDGVHSILSDSTGPIFVCEALVREIAAREADGEFDDTKPHIVQTSRGEKTVPVPRWVEVGGKITVRNGPFASFPGKIEEIISSEQVKVGVMIFGRSMPIVLDLAQLEER